MNDQNTRIIGVINPFTGELAGTVPKATVEDVRRAFSIAAAYHSSLTRHGRATILQKAAELLRSRTEAASDLITRESGLGKKDSLYEVGPACDLLTFSAMEELKDVSQAFPCDLTHP